MDTNNKITGVMCKVTDCHYHSTDNKCTAGQIEVCNCHNCDCTGSKEDMSFCSTYRKNN